MHFRKNEKRKIATTDLAANRLITEVRNNTKQNSIATKKKLCANNKIVQAKSTNQLEYFEYTIEKKNG